MESLTRSDRRALKIVVLADVSNVRRLAAGPDPAWERCPGRENTLAADCFKLRDLYRCFVPGVQTAEPTHFAIEAPQGSEVPVHRIAYGSQYSWSGLFKRSCLRECLCD